MTGRCRSRPPGRAGRGRLDAQAASEHFTDNAVELEKLRTVARSLQDNSTNVVPSELSSMLAHVLRR